MTGQNAQTFDGPPVHSEPSIVTIFSAEQIQHSDFLPGLIKTINAAYLKGHKSKPELRMELNDRLGSTEEFLANVSSDPESFTIVVARPGSTKVIATVSAARFHGPPEGVSSPWMRTLHPEEGSVEWVLKLMATEPSAGRQGLAGFLLALAEREIVRRSGEARDLDETPTSSPVKMGLCTPKELNESFYSKRGYLKDYEVPRGDPFNFHVIHMSKVLKTDDTTA